jgi:hypothetical protein
VQQGRVDLEVSKKFWKFASPVVLDVAHGFSSYAHQGKVLQVTSASFKARTVNPKNFSTELKRRHIHKVAIAYKPSFALDSG